MGSPCNRLDGRRVYRDVISAPAPGLDLGREYGYHQSPAIRAAGLIFCSGMLAINPRDGRARARDGNQRSASHLQYLKLLLEPAGSSLNPPAANAPRKLLLKIAEIVY